MNAVHPPPSVDVVDDDLDVLGSLRFLLETEGFDVRTFASAADFLACGSASISDCLVVDYKMDGMDGLDLIRCLRADRMVFSVVLITGYPDEAIEKKAASVGVRHVVLKPHVDESLVLHVRAAIAEGERPDPARRHLR